MRPCTAFLLLSALVVAGGCQSSTSKQTTNEPRPWDTDPPTWAADIVIEGPQEDQEAVRSFIYHLTKNVDEGRLDPFGGTNERYRGRIFWDADVWVFPALALVDPKRAQLISRYRLQTAQFVQAETCNRMGGSYAESAAALLQSSHDRVDPGLPLKFNWESDAAGLDPVGAPTNKQEHVSGDVVWGLQMASDLGLVDQTTVNDIGSAVANYYMLRSVETLSGRSIRDVVTVDEWVDADNCLFTNAIAEWVVKTYTDAPDKFAIPRDPNGNVVAYDGDPVRAYKQASAPLVLWPLEREDLVGDPIKFLERFKGKESPNGPAMSLSIYALIRARYGDADAALQTWRESWKRYTDRDLQFQEEPGREDLTYFNTGAAGCLNAVVYGFIGARLVSQPRPDDAKIEIENGKWLVFRPNLPNDWKKVTFKNIRVLSETYEVVCAGMRATVKKVAEADASAQ